VKTLRLLIYSLTSLEYWIARTSRATTAWVLAQGRYLIGGAYWMPPLLHSEFSPRGIFSFDPSPTLRS
jgi:hypothetical protein